ncbi:hypothetical protein Hanom_Chr17g01574401 [Helianthus anomalus]
MTTQKSLETTSATSSQQLERSPPNQTPVKSTQKDQVLSTGTPHHEADISLESLFHSPSPRATSLSSPQPSTPIPPTFLLLFDAIETQIHLSPYHSLVKESTLSYVTQSEQFNLLAHKQLRRLHHLSFMQLLVVVQVKQPLQLLKQSFISWAVVKSISLP